MRRRTRVVTLGTSLALHGGLLLAVLVAVSGEAERGALVIDLTDSGQSAATGGAAGPPAAAPAGRGSAHARRPIVTARSAPASVASPDTAEPLPAAEPAVSPGQDAESPAPSLLPPAPPAPPDVAPPDPGPDVAEALEPSVPGPSPQAPPSSAVGAPERAGAQGEGSRTQRGGAGIQSEAVSSRGVRGGGPGGAPDVSHGFALAVPGGSPGGAGGPGSEYGAYLRRLRARVQQSLRYPLAARRRGLSGTVNVEIVIRPDGAISAVAVADSSSHTVLDDAAVETIRRLAPEPFPPDVPPRTLRVRLPVVFALE